VELPPGGWTTAAGGARPGPELLDRKSQVVAEWESIVRQTQSIDLKFRADFPQTFRVAQAHQLE
jgi:hypothetical protein